MIMSIAIHRPLHLFQGGNNIFSLPLFEQDWLPSPFLYSNILLHCSLLRQTFKQYHIARDCLKMSLHLEDAIPKLRDIGIRSPYIFYGVIIFILCYWWKSTELNNPSRLPVIGRRWYEIGNGKARQRIRDDCLGIVRSCLQKVCHVPILVYYLFF